MSSTRYWPSTGTFGPGRQKNQIRSVKDLKLNCVWLKACEEKYPLQEDRKAAYTQIWRIENNLVQDNSLTLQKFLFFYPSFGIFAFNVAICLSIPEIAIPSSSFSVPKPAIDIDASPFLAVHS